jgi:hypothetical protein
MNDDALGAFARQMAAEASELAADFPDPADALEAVGSLLRRAANNPSAIVQAASAGKPRPTRPERALPDAASIYAARAAQVAGKG